MFTTRSLSELDKHPELPPEAGDPMWAQQRDHPFPPILLYSTLVLTALRSRVISHLHRVL